ncbi:potassium-transporting ATPase subunit F [Pseudanabaena sp. lw0831]|uniref:potassium-transporting ATPase subunit F n=1 Tax=Pseudanabaena sp. lw0831 TaxID=1357935 RepID=UPI00191538E8|nr:potassium-transporting ATPase subunit F [Pseudanabaena sp. lw0831]
MKKTLPNVFSDFSIEDLKGLWQLSIKKKYPKYLFLLLCFNLIVAPAVYAANADSFTRTQAYALGLLGIVTVGFSIYLFVVMFQPEKF